VEFDKFHRPLGRVAYNRNVDYSKKCVHNPILVKPDEEREQPEQTGTIAPSAAIEKAREAEERFRERRQRREESEERYRQVSEEGGREALRRLAD